MKSLKKISAILMTTALLVPVFYGLVFCESQSLAHNLPAQELNQKIEGLENAFEKNPEDVETLKTLGIAYHFQASEGEKTAVPKAVEMLKKAVSKKPADYETLCYLGSARTMMAETTWNPIKKMSHVNKGTALMDRAVKRAPDNITVRMIRGANSLRMPAFLNRVGCAVEDYGYLAELINQYPEKLAAIKNTVLSGLKEARRRQNKTADKQKNMQEQIN